MNPRYLLLLSAVTGLVVVLATLIAPGSSDGGSTALGGPNGMPLNDLTWIFVAGVCPIALAMASAGHGRGMLWLRLMRHGSRPRWLAAELSRDARRLVTIVGVWVILILGLTAIRARGPHTGVEFYQLCVNLPLQMILCLTLAFAITRSRAPALAKLAVAAVLAVGAAVPLATWPWNPLTAGALARTQLGFGAILASSLLVIACEALAITIAIVSSLEFPAIPSTKGVPQ